MATNEVPTPAALTAKLFMHGRSQAVRLPKAFRFEGSEVSVRREGLKVILEPLSAASSDRSTRWAAIDAAGGADFLADGIPDLPPPEPDDGSTIE